MSIKFEPVSTDHMAKELTPPPALTEADSKVAQIIADARKRERRMRAQWDATKELNGSGDFDPYKAPDTDELHRIAEDILPTETLKQAIKEREGA